MLPYEFFTIARNGGSRVFATATLTDDRTGIVDTDRGRLTAVGHN